MFYTASNILPALTFTILPFLSISCALAPKPCTSPPSTMNSVEEFDLILSKTTTGRTASVAYVFDGRNLGTDDTGLAGLIDAISLLPKGSIIIDRSPAQKGIPVTEEEDFWERRHYVKRWNDIRDALVQREIKFILWDKDVSRISDLYALPGSQDCKMPYCKD